MGKNEKTTHRSRVSLDKRGPHTGSAGVMPLCPRLLHDFLPPWLMLPKKRDHGLGNRLGLLQHEEVPGLGNFY